MASNKRLMRLETSCQAENKLFGCHVTLVALFYLAPLKILKFLSLLSDSNIPIVVSVILFDLAG